MYHSGNRRPREGRRPLGVVEIACIVVVVLAIAMLVAWIITHAGGGALMT